MINRKILGPQKWSEYPTFWLEAVKFKAETLFRSMTRRHRP